MDTPSVDAKVFNNLGITINIKAVIKYHPTSDTWAVIDNAERIIRIYNQSGKWYLSYPDEVEFRKQEPV